MKPVSSSDSAAPNPASKTKTVRPFLLAIISIAVCIGIGIVLTLAVLNVFNTQKNASKITDVKSDGNKLITNSEQAVSNVVEAVSPSVVSIMTQINEGRSPWGRMEIQTGAGTGVIVSKDGYVLTNKHVVDDARAIQIVLSDGTVHDNVRLIAKDPVNDISFLKIDGAKNLQPAQLGDSTTIKIGQNVIAIGNSLGQYQNTVTTGIISGTGRPITAENGDSIENLTDLLQTDAAINPGNSGGPLLNSSGQVIGINTAIAADAQGIGFAIPITATKGMLKQVLEGKSPKRAYLGVRYTPVDAKLAKEKKLPTNHGAYVYANGERESVERGSPADKAGIKSDDVITKVAGVDIGPRGGLSSLIAAHAPGDTIDISIIRDGHERKLQVVLSAYR